MNQISPKIEKLFSRFLSDLGTTPGGLIESGIINPENFEKRQSKGNWEMDTKISRYIEI